MFDIFILCLISNAQSVLTFKGQWGLVKACRCRQMMFIRYTIVMVSGARSISLELCEGPRNDQTCGILAQRSRVSLLEDKHLLLLLRKNTRLLSLIAVCTGLVPGTTDLLTLAKVAPTLASVECTMKIFIFHDAELGTCALGTRFLTRFAFAARPDGGSDIPIRLSDGTDTKRITGGTAAKAG